MQGQGSLVLIDGEAGIGKTSLAAWLRQQATEQGVLALAARCYDLAETPPYGPWLECLARYDAAEDLPPLPALFSTLDVVSIPTGQAALFTQARDFLTQVAARCSLLLEDRLWADPASLEFLRFVGRALSSSRLLVVVTYRDDEVTRQHPLNALLPVQATATDRGSPAPVRPSILCQP